MERFIPYRISIAKLERERVKLCKSERDDVLYIPNSADDEIEVEVKELLKATRPENVESPGQWAGDGECFVRDGQVYLVDPKTTAGSMLRAMLRFGAKTGRVFASEFTDFYYAGSWRLPERWAQQHLFFDSDGETLQVSDSDNRQQVTHGTDFLTPAGTWMEESWLWKETGRSVAPPVPLEGLGLGHHWDHLDWLPRSLAAYQGFLSTSPIYANEYAVRLVADSPEIPGRGSFGPGKREALLTLMCLPLHLADWVRMVHLQAARVSDREELARGLSGMRALVKERTWTVAMLLLVGWLAAFVAFRR